MKLFIATHAQIEPCQIPSIWEDFVTISTFTKYPNKLRTHSVQVMLSTPDIHCILLTHETESVNIISESMPHSSTFSMDFTSCTHCILGNSSPYLKGQD